MEFQKNVLKIASIIFIIVMIILALVIKSSYKNAIFPPEISLCPDFWDVSQDGKRCIATKQNNGLFREGETSDDFSDMSNSARIDKCNWAKDNQVMWDGITNRNLC